MGRASGPRWRIDEHPPQGWRWDGFGQPRNRFDPLSGRFRVRYAANAPVVAARERFPSRSIAAGDGDLWLARLDGDPSALHLTHTRNLDVLQVDDRVSTGRIDDARPDEPDRLLDVCGALADAVYDWWDGAPPPLVYRARTTPTGRSMAFTSNDPWERVGARRLREAVGLLAELVLKHGFIVPDVWLAP